ncbi:MAG: hypothetical protein ACI4D8_04725 [Wujia sp.]
MNNTEKAKYELAKKMLKGKIEIDEVALMTGISMDKLEEINNEINPKNPDVELLKNLDTTDFDLGPILFDDLPAEDEELEGFKPYDQLHEEE